MGWPQHDSILWLTRSCVHENLVNPDLRNFEPARSRMHDDPTMPDNPITVERRFAPARSYLFVPGDRPERFDRAWNTTADEIVIDLEDAVAPQAKAKARHSIANWLDADRPVLLRVNAADTPWFADDLRLSCHPGVAGVMLPKAESLPSELINACSNNGLGILALIETALGMQRIADLANSPHVTRLAFGSIDFQIDLGIEGDDEELLFFRSQLVWHSRLAGLSAPVDGVTADFSDDDRLRSDARRARRLGFGGKLCIHPRQLQAVSAAFLPDEAQRTWAARVLLAVETAQGAAVALDGKMVDRPVWLQALRIASSAAQTGPARLQASRVACK